MEPRAPQDSQLLALRSRHLSLSRRTSVGQSVHQSAQAKAGKLMTTMMVTPSDVFDAWARVYDEQPNPLLSLEQRFLSRMLPVAAGLNILDAGCGTGRWLQFLAAYHPASLVGVDTSSEMLQRASIKLGTASTLTLGSCTALPVPNTAIDLVLSSFVLSYLEDVEIFAREVHRVTRQGATIFVSDMHPGTAIACGWKRSFKAKGTEEHLRTNGLSIEQITDIFQ